MAGIKDNSFGLNKPIAKLNQQRLKKLAHAPNSSQFLTTQQEDIVYNQLKQIISNSQDALNNDSEKKMYTLEQKKQIAALVRYSTKLLVRQKRRQKNQTPFDLDTRIAQILQQRKSSQRLSLLFNPDELESLIPYTTKSFDSLTEETEKPVKKKASSSVQNNNNDNGHSVNVTNNNNSNNNRSNHEIASHFSHKPLIRSVIDYKNTTTTNNNNTQTEYLTLDYLMGVKENENKCFRSLFSRKVLSPYIWRNFSPNVKKIKLLEEIVSHCHRNDVKWAPPPSEPIDFCYFQEKHRNGVNRLLREHFSPLIDVRESLNYPDYTIIALYKKLVVGCAFMTPRFHINYLFVRPEWEGSQIGEFMLYHLIQLVDSGKEITSYVSISKQSTSLFQKFGFKTTQLLKNFFNNYLPKDSAVSKDAYLLTYKKV